MLFSLVDIFSPAKAMECDGRTDYGRIKSLTIALGFGRRLARVRERVPDRLPPDVPPLDLVE